MAIRTINQIAIICIFIIETNSVQSVCFNDVDEYIGKFVSLGFGHVGYAYALPVSKNG